MCYFRADGTKRLQNCSEWKTLFLTIGWICWNHCYFWSVGRRCLNNKIITDDIYFCVRKFLLLSVLSQKWIDGGFTDSLPILPEGRTITVSPFAGLQDVCPVHTGRFTNQLRLANMNIMVSCKFLCSKKITAVINNDNWRFCRCTSVALVTWPAIG